MKSLEELKVLRDETMKKMQMRYVEGGYRIQVGMGTCGIASGAKQVLQAFLENIETHQLKNVAVTQVGCMGECAYEPMAEVIDVSGQSFVYCNINLANVKEIVEKHLVGGTPIERYLLVTKKG
jgi:NADP-reducing hydrogenase subunit HndB